MLVTKDLEVGYRNQRETISVARSINFALAKSEMAAIVGVNGIGKSTLLRTLARVQEKLSGSVEVDGTPIDKYRQKDWATKVSVVLTETLAAKNLSVQQLIGLGRNPYTNWIGTLSPTDIAKIQEAIELMGLGELKDKKCHELSDGQLQKVMIARALTQDTSVILLDEPTTHLDLYHKVQILKLLQEIAHTKKKTILYTTHEIDLAIQLCDKILIMEENRNSFGSPETLIRFEHFNRLFPADTIKFDPETGSFKIYK
ncbi:MAG: ABC transporter ATP-binding protein [Flavobacteriaceae bacterium]